MYAETRMTLNTAGPPTAAKDDRLSAVTVEELGINSPYIKEDHACWLLYNSRILIIADNKVYNDK